MGLAVPREFLELAIDIQPFLQANAQLGGVVAFVLQYYMIWHTCIVQEVFGKRF